ncbi:VWA domain-containing protein [Halegenticoccus soli]|uniref:VWA domain-containing protein n=1 Tax=Halegenticoccus soli TaxID=1985678 RepID=UPI000C6E828E|nr:VWA domain-containing protein [Halegenticoccus soli]
MVANAGGKKLSSLPFPAIVGQEELKRALLAVAVDDDLDGALLVGEKGTAKSTAVRALADLLPDQRAVADCPYGCSPDDPRLQCADCREREDPPIEFRSAPLVTLPLGATRDRVVGTLSVEDALAGEADFDPGLLARAHRGILYVDEVNLLEDHLVDVLLDAAASGVNAVERDGVSVSHPAAFTLIGTMNPEEGDLRPQLRDRFALRASVEGCRDLDDRVEIIDRALDRREGAVPANAAVDELAPVGGESDSVEDESDDADEVDALRERLADARDRLKSVEIPAEFKREIARLCLDAGVDGHRGDIATARAARALAALDGRSSVIESDVAEAASYTLPHRLESTPFEETPDLDELLADRFGDGAGAETEDGDSGDGNRGDAADEGDGTTDDRGSEDGSDSETGSAGDDRCDRDGLDSGGSADHDGSDDGVDTDRDAGDGSDPSPESASDRPAEDGDSTDGHRPRSPGSSAADRSHAAADGDDGGDGSDDSDVDPGDADSGESAAPLIPGRRRADVGDATAPTLGDPRVESGDPSGGSRTNASPSADNRGARVRTEPASGEGPVDAAASVRSAASRGASRVEARDLRRSVRTGRASVAIVFVVDASASMRPAMRAAKGVVLDLLRDSYQRRDEVAFVAFAGDDADVLLPPTRSVTLAARHLKELPSGDRTPLPAGLETARSVVDGADSDAAVVVLVTDGRANVADGGPTGATREAARRLARTGAEVVVVDAGDDSRAGLTGLVAAETDGELAPLSSLTAETVRTAADSASSERRRTDRRG